METPPARYKILLTTIEAKDDSYMDVEEFDHVPRVGEYVAIGRHEPQVYRVVQIVHCLDQYGYSYAATVEPAQLSHRAVLNPTDARDG